MDLSIPINPGPVYSWKGVSWQGNLAVQSSDLDRAVDLKPGDVADGMKIESLWQKIESEYGRRGYLDMKLNAEPQFDDSAHQISYRVSIVGGRAITHGRHGHHGIIRGRGKAFAAGLADCSRPDF